VVNGDPRIKGLAHLARELARDNPDDGDCIRLLLNAVGSRKRDLSRAAAVERFDGLAKESRVRDRANRLLLAAHSGKPVVPLSRDLDDLFTRIEVLYSVRVEDAFPTLVELQPELRRLERQFNPRTFGEDQSEAIWDELIEALAPIIGPKAEIEVTDPLLRTRSAHNIARLFLALRVGLLDEAEYD
jgi:hypothetical protein